MVRLTLIVTLKQDYIKTKKKNKSYDYHAC